MHAASLRRVRERVLARPLFFEGMRATNCTALALALAPDGRRSPTPALGLGHWLRHDDWDEENEEEERRRLEFEAEEMRLLVEQIKAVVPLVARTIGSLFSAVLFNAICAMLGCNFHRLQLD